MPNPKVEGLTKKEKEFVSLLALGTFLEYFDLMLYVHMAVLVNDLFFPKTDNPQMLYIYGAIAFCSSYILRPFGGLLIGWVGDRLGRKVTILITSFSMAIACLIMSAAPTYEKIGIAATLIVTGCRMVQGFSSMGEITGAYVYLTESLKSPTKYSMATVIAAFNRFGSLFALIVAYFAVTSQFEWRLAFLFGSGIALVGFYARSKLRETVEFAKHITTKNQKNSAEFFKQFANVDKLKVIFSYFIISFPATIWTYFAYLDAPIFMKQVFNFNTEQVLSHNMLVVFMSALIILFYSLVLKKTHPLKLNTFKLMVLAITLPFIPYFFDNIKTPLMLLLFQVLLISFFPSGSGYLDSMCSKYFKISTRFTNIGFLFGSAHSVGYVISSFSLIYLREIFGNYGFVIYVIPVMVLYIIACNYFKKLEIQKGRYHHYPYKDEDVEADIHPYNYELGEEYKPYQKECKYSKMLIEVLESINNTAKKPVNIKLVKKAIAFAKKWHDGQKRKTGEPYYTHPLAVAMMTAEYKFKTHMVVAAILHDVVEDSDCTVELIAKEFTPRIAEIVGLLTREYDDKKLTIAESIKKIFDATDYEALLIKGLDRIHNLQTIHGMKSKKQKEIAEETIYEIANVAAYAVDDLNINDKGKLERKLYKLSNRALKKSRMSANQ